MFKSAYSGIRENDKKRKTYTLSRGGEDLKERTYQHRSLPVAVMNS